MLVVSPFGPESLQSHCVMLLNVLEVSLGVRVNRPQESVGSWNPALGLEYRVIVSVYASAHPVSEVVVSESRYCWL